MVVEPDQLHRQRPGPGRPIRHSVSEELIGLSQARVRVPAGSMSSQRSSECTTTPPWQATTTVSPVVPLDQRVQRAPHPRAHLAERLAARVPPGVHRPGLRERPPPVVLLDVQPVPLARVVLAEVAVPPHGQPVERGSEECRPSRPPGPSRWSRARSCRPARRRGQPVAQRPDLGPPPVGQPLAPVVAADDPALLGERLAVPDQDDAGLHLTDIKAGGGRAPWQELVSHGRRRPRPRRRPGRRRSPGPCPARSARAACGPAWRPPRAAGCPARARSGAPAPAPPARWSR